MLWLNIYHNISSIIFRRRENVWFSCLHAGVIWDALNHPPGFTGFSDPEKAVFHISCVLSLNLMQTAQVAQGRSPTLEPRVKEWIEFIQGVYQWFSIFFANVSKSLCLCKLNVVQIRFSVILWECLSYC